MINALFAIALKPSWSTNSYLIRIFILLLKLFVESLVFGLLIRVPSILIELSLFLRICVEAVLRAIGCESRACLIVITLIRIIKLSLNGVSESCICFNNFLELLLSSRILVMIGMVFFDQFEVPLLYLPWRGVLGQVHDFIERLGSFTEESI